MLGSWMMSDGSGSDVIEIPAGGVRTPSTRPDSMKVTSTSRWMGGQYGDSLSRPSPGCQGVLERIGRDLSEVDLIIPHQANLRIVEAGMENLGLPMDKTFTNLQRYGNTAGASVPIALREAVDEGLVNSGDLIVTAAFGGGLAWGANAFVWT